MIDSAYATHPEVRLSTQRKIHPITTPYFRTNQTNKSAPCRINFPSIPANFNSSFIFFVRLTIDPPAYLIRSCDSLSYYLAISSLQYIFCRFSDFLRTFHLLESLSSLREFSFQHPPFSASRRLQTHQFTLPLLTLPPSANPTEPDDPPTPRHSTCTLHQ